MLESSVVVISSESPVVVFVILAVEKVGVAPTVSIRSEANAFFSAPSVAS